MSEVGEPDAPPRAAARRLRVLVITHETLVPPDDLSGYSDQQIEEFKAEYDVVKALRDLGHDVHVLGLYDELMPLRQAIEELRPHVTFNLLEEFSGQAIYDQNVVSYLELLRMPYTGNSPRGMVIARDKALTKKILHYHRIRVPRFAVFPIGRTVRRPRGLDFPVIVKSQIEEASTGIAQASVVSSDDKLVERVQFVHESIRTPAIVEEYIDGREVYVSVLGNRRLLTLPVWEIRFDKMSQDSYAIATRKAKFDLDYQKARGIHIGPAQDLSPELERRIHALSRRIYRHLDLSGYARLDFRLAADGRLYLLEANPNPDISSDEELASAAAAAGIGYEALIQKIVSLGLRRNRA